jgi:ethanolamine ammonia-lyase small subunit
VALDLRNFTPARVALGRTGHSLPVRELLRFQLDHARARDAVYEALDPSWIPQCELVLHSAAADRTTYLRRPNLGRKLNEESRSKLARGDYDAAIVIADGLSATAIHRHAPALLTELLPRLTDWKLAPISVVLQGRVAIGDEIGEALGARLVVVLIGERPGLSSPDSLGVYLTWEPRVGRTDAERNCISNIRTEGLSYQAASHILELLMRASRERKLSGVGLSSAGLPACTSERSSP